MPWPLNVGSERFHEGRGAGKKTTRRGSRVLLLIALRSVWICRCRTF